MMRGRWSPEKTKRVRGLARVAVYFSCATLVSGVISVRHARAEYQDQTLAFGRQMFQLAKASNHEVTKIHFNGQPVHVASSSTADSPESVLARYEAYCQANRGQEPGDLFGDVGSDFEPAAPAHANRPASPDGGEAANAIAKAGFVRSGSDTDGSVICFAKGPKAKPTTKEAVAAFLATGELGAFGELRYAYAAQGPSGKTLVLTVWTDSTFNLRDMIPADGEDAPGEDFPELPRVPNATRVMSARADRMPYGVNLYKTSDAPDKTLSFFDQEMKARGWFTYDPEMTVAEHAGLGRAYMKDAVVITLGTSTQADGNFVAVGLSGVAEDDRLGRR